MPLRDPSKRAVSAAAAYRRDGDPHEAIQILADVLTKDALDELYRYCLESTVWFDYRHPPGYVGAMLVDGFTCPLLLQLAEEALRSFEAELGLKSPETTPLSPAAKDLGPATEKQST